MESIGLQARVASLVEAAGPVHGRATWRPLGEGVGGRRWQFQWGGQRWFVKCGDAEVLDAEADGLRALASAGALRVPVVRACGMEGGTGFLLLEWMQLARGHGAAGALLGEALARQHLMPVGGFGWPRHNFIGATPQFNTPATGWVAFFREQRLGFQLRLAAENGYRGTLQESGLRLVAELPRFFAGHDPRPSLLHGDLWVGNWGVLPDGRPAVFDPAVYRGDREADIAMTELFGGFDPEFYAAYRMHAPLDAGYAVRRNLYDLYHVLNHLNLFGDAYLDQALSLMGRLLGEVR